MYLLYLHILSIVCLPNSAPDMLIFKIIPDPLAAKNFTADEETSMRKC